MHMVDLATGDGRIHATHLWREPYGGDGRLELEHPLIAVTRDPRDTLVSYYFDQTVRWGDAEWAAGKGQSMSEFVQDPGHGVSDWARFEAHVLAARPDHVVVYRDLRADPHAELARLLEFLGVEGDVDKAVRESTMDKMRLLTTKAVRPTSTDPNSQKVRRGVVGGYIDYLTEDDLDHFHRVLDRAPLVFPYWQPRRPRERADSPTA